MKLSKPIKKTIQCLLLFFSLILILLYLNNIAFPGKKNISENNISNDRINADSYIQLGIFDLNNNIIDNGSTIQVNNNVIKHTVSMDQKDTISKEYLLLVLVDFKQVSFTIDDKEFDKYQFTLNKNSSININTEVIIDSNAGEVDYLIIPNPNKDISNISYEEMVSLQNVYISRFKIDNSIKNISYDQSFNLKESEVMPYIFISNLPDEFKLLSDTLCNQDLYLSFGNSFSEKVDYAVIILKNWNQSHFTDNEIVKYVSVDPKQTISSSIKFNETDKDSIIQILALPLPYKTDKDNHFSTSAFGTTRFYIKN